MSIHGCCDRIGKHHYANIGRHNNGHYRPSEPNVEVVSHFGYSYNYPTFGETTRLSPKGDVYYGTLAGKSTALWPDRSLRHIGRKSYGALAGNPTAPWPDANSTLAGHGNYGTSAGKPTAPWPDRNYGTLADVVPIVYVIVIVIVIVPNTHNENILSLDPTFRIEGQVARQTNDDNATPPAQTSGRRPRPLPNTSCKQ